MVEFLNQTEVNLPKYEENIQLSETGQSLKGKYINRQESIHFFGITAYRFHGKT